MACHTRSTSLPSRSHPHVLRAEEELNKLKAYVASLSLPYEILIDAIEEVGNVYECINDLFCISSIRIDISHSKQRRFVNQDLEESIKLIDICSASKDYLDSIKGQLQDFESALRKGESEVTRATVKEYTILVKKADKDVQKLPSVSKSETTLTSSSNVAELMLEILEVVILLLQSIFSFLPKHIVGQKTSKWPSVKRLFQKSRVTCEEPEDNYCDITSLLMNIEGLQKELEILYRHLVKCRVSLLNMCSF